MGSWSCEVAKVSSSYQNVPSLCSVYLDGICPVLLFKEELDFFMSGVDNVFPFAF